MRMFAGPNGSGKSELKSYLPESLLGRYLNPDEIESGIRQSGFLNLPAWGVMTTLNRTSFERWGWRKVRLRYV